MTRRQRLIRAQAMISNVRRELPPDTSFVVREALHQVEKSLYDVLVNAKLEFLYALPTREQI